MNSSFIIALVWKSAGYLAFPFSLIFVYLLFEGPFSAGYLVPVVLSLLALFVAAVLATYVAYRIRTRTGFPQGWENLTPAERGSQAVLLAWTWPKLGP